MAPQPGNDHSAMRVAAGVALHAQAHHTRKAIWLMRLIQ